MLVLDLSRFHHAGFRTYRVFQQALGRLPLVIKSADLLLLAVTRPLFRSHSFQALFRPLTLCHQPHGRLTIVTIFFPHRLLYLSPG